MTQKTPACSANCLLPDFATVICGEAMHGYRGQLSSWKRRRRRTASPLGGRYLEPEELLGAAP
jgi:hypothetical protein